MSTSLAGISLAQSLLSSLPVRSLVPLTRASDERSRLASCSRDISSEKNATVFFDWHATLRAILSAKLVLPIPGRAARMIRSLRLSPVIMRSRSPMPVGIALVLLSRSELRSSRRSKVCKMTEFILSRPFDDSSLRMSNNLCSAASRMSDTSSAPSEASSMIAREAATSCLSLYFSATMRAY